MPRFSLSAASGQGCGEEAAAGLTPTERRLWQMLTGEPGRVFTRAELTTRVMPDTIVEERTIDVHISRLRKKLGSAGANIELVRKKGYRWKKE